MTNSTTNGLDAASDIAVAAHGPAPLELDLAEYAPHVADFDMADEQKRELLETLWSIMASFVALGFDVGKADICGQLLPEFNAASGDSPDGVNSFSSKPAETPSTTNGKEPAS